MARLAGTVFALFALVLGLLWMTTARVSVDVAGTPPDPLAARRRAAAIPPREDSPIPDTPAPASGAFFEPSFSTAASPAASDEDEELAHLVAQAERDPRDADARSSLGQLLVARDRIGEALAHLERAVQLEPGRGDHHVNLARARAGLRRWSEAADAYRDAQRLLPDDAVTAFNLGLALHKSGDDTGAVNAYRRAIELNPSEAAVRLALAISYERLQKNADAAAAYGEYLRLAPADPDADRVRARMAELAPS